MVLLFWTFFPCFMLNDVIWLRTEIGNYAENGTPSIGKFSNLYLICEMDGDVDEVLNVHGVRKSTKSSVFLLLEQHIRALPKLRK